MDHTFVPLSDLAQDLQMHRTHVKKFAVKHGAVLTVFAPARRAIKKPSPSLVPMLTCCASSARMDWRQRTI